MLVEKQVRRVQRRLFVQVVLQNLILGWAMALLVATLWFLLRPLVFAGLGETVALERPGGSPGHRHARRIIPRLAAPS